MIQVEYNQPISILIDLEEIHSYIDPNLVEILQLNKSKHNR